MAQRRSQINRLDHLQARTPRSHRRYLRETHRMASTLIPLDIYAGDTLVWSGDTDRSLGYVHLNIEHPVLSDTYTIRLRGTAEDNDAFGQIVEVVEPKAGELDLFKAEGGDKTNHELRIVEIEFLETLNK